MQPDGTPRLLERKIFPKNEKEESMNRAERSTRRTKKQSRSEMQSNHSGERKEPREEVPHHCAAAVRVLDQGDEMPWLEKVRGVGDWQVRGEGGAEEERGLSAFHLVPPVFRSERAEQATQVKWFSPPTITAVYIVEGPNYPSAHMLVHILVCACSFVSRDVIVIPKKCWK